MSAQLRTAEKPPAQSPIRASVDPVSAENVVRARVRVIELFRGASQLIQEADAIARKAHLGGLDVLVQVKAPGLDSFNAEQAERHLQQALDASGWRYVVSESSVREFVDPLMRARWTRRLDEGEVLELTMENVAYMVQAACDAHRQAMPTTHVEC